MSFDINWDKLVSDDSISNSIKDFLNDQFNEISLPSFVDTLSVTGFSLGSIPPNITIRHIGNPFDEFYKRNVPEEEAKKGQLPVSPELSGSDSDSSEEEPAINNLDSANQQDFTPLLPEVDSLRRQNQESKHFNNFNMNNVGLGHMDLDTPTNFFNPHAYRLHSNSVGRNESVKKNDNDIQFILEIDYKGDVALEIVVNLLVNYPSAHFITLPIKLKITDLVIHSLAAVAYLENSVFISFLCDLNDADSDYFTSASMHRRSDAHSRGSHIPPSSGGNITDYVPSNNKERIDVIRSVKIDTEIGEMENNVLRNVGKVEKFLVEQLRNIIRDETAWPSWICLDFNDDDDDDDDQSSTASTQHSSHTS
ncbi:putative mitochondrial distribution and morphology protein [Clavispora lusitaniae]|uniref:Mitochondrial distribution and morphology protein n=1 Tax=Clavispora lusitaniae TaxID=36911 RepID=A0ACD0WT79_CLALS|nr:Mitochondrial distribution and morphology protein 12 [Clavispora lusitaniae]KAF7580665.1 hypothetical protein FOB63_004603 [Clavispora lusitaniae]QFZ30550.1 putative mitochondrial distribution and morphology protein [Clavispora lusitaniae]QFZ36212.1 putative mitochondrial distribution and morphology protein [Clavispora lusitaniae]QFZ41896.1 putative mitochondrial distribution and morphology protein [Clavispora lusitaniae]